MKSLPRLAALLALASLAPAALPAQVAWRKSLSQPADWYASAEARELAATVALYQTPSGGWPKNTDFSEPPSDSMREEIQHDVGVATIDNQGTTQPLKLLARVIDVAPADAAESVAPLRAAFERGFDYLLVSQYENGGWPQFYPLRPGYYTRITFNDQAMVNVLNLLDYAASGRAPYRFVDADRRARAATAVAKGLDCILRTQVRDADGRLTTWCAQHDEKTLAPAWARNFEPPSLSGSESVGIVRFLLSRPNPTPEIIAAVEGAAAWFEKVKITGLRYETFKADDGKPDRRVVPDPDAPPLWARFYELGTDRPLFLGRDKTFHYVYAEIERERRVGYAYYGPYAENLLAKEIPAWRAKLARKNSE